MRVKTPTPTRRGVHRLHVPASRHSRYLRGVARAAEALVLASWYSGKLVGRPGVPSFAPPPVLSTELAELAGTPRLVLEGILSNASHVLHLDGSLGPPLADGDEQPPEVLAALTDGVQEAVVTIEALEGLARLLGTPTPPELLATFDISHLYGTDTVGSSAALSRGVTDLAGYACYPISGAAPADDPGAIAEVLRARLGDGAAGLGLARPDCLLIDGGKAQLSAACGVLRELGLESEVAVLALAKREEELYVPGRSAPIALAEFSPTLTLLRRQRDEAHATALLSHRTLRSMAGGAVLPPEVHAAASEGLGLHTRRRCSRTARSAAWPEGPSWRRHGWPPPEAHAAASEGVGLPYQAHRPGCV